MFDVIGSHIVEICDVCVMLRLLDDSEKLLSDLLGFFKFSRQRVQARVEIRTNIDHSDRIQNIKFWYLSTVIIRFIRILWILEWNKPVSDIIDSQIVTQPRCLVLTSRTCVYYCWVRALTIWIVNKLYIDEYCRYEVLSVRKWKLSWRVSKTSRVSTSAVRQVSYWSFLTILRIYYHID